MVMEAASFDVRSRRIFNTPLLERVVRRAVAVDASPKVFLEVALEHAMSSPEVARAAKEREAAEKERRHREHLAKRTVYRHRRLL